MIALQAESAPFVHVGGVHIDKRGVLPSLYSCSGSGLDDLDLAAIRALAWHHSVLIRQRSY